MTVTTPKLEMSVVLPDFELIERRLTTVLDALSDELSADERREIVEFIEHREYGIALETLCAILIEEHKIVSQVVCLEIVEVADCMEMIDAEIVMLFIQWTASGRDGMEGM